MVEGGEGGGGGGGGGGHHHGFTRELDQTPTWAVAAVCSVIIIISILLENGLHHIGEWFAERRKKAMFEALEKIKSELMILGFISLLLTFGQKYITQICITEETADTMLPCLLKPETVAAERKGDQGKPEEGGESHHGRVLWHITKNLNSMGRILAEGRHRKHCPRGEVSLVSEDGLHQLHMFIFFLAAFHVLYSALTMALGRAKIRLWKEWEREISSLEYESSNDPRRVRLAHETSFVRQHESSWNKIPVSFYFVRNIVTASQKFFRTIVVFMWAVSCSDGKAWCLHTWRCGLTSQKPPLLSIGLGPSCTHLVGALCIQVSFFRQFYRSVRKADYLSMRHGFISVHLAPGSKFDFQKYIKRSLEDDFKVVVGISPTLWASAVLFLLLNINGWQTLLWISIMPLIIILAVGTKLQAIITQMALEIKERHSVVQGIPLVQVSDHHFWFGRPHLVLFFIHFTLFQDAFQLIYLFWMWYEFGWDSCFHQNPQLIVARVCLGVGVQFLCSYITLPLYALVSQMGSQMKRSIFDEQTSKALKKWHQGARKNLRTNSFSRSSPNLSLKSMTSLVASPSKRKNASDPETSAAKPDVPNSTPTKTPPPQKAAAPVDHGDLLTGTPEQPTQRQRQQSREEEFFLVKL